MQGELTVELRTIRQAVAEIKAKDPNTAMTENFLRMLLDNNRIPYTPNGNRRLVVVANVESFLRQGKAV